MLDDRERMRKMGEAIADFALLDCADLLYDDLLKNVLKSKTDKTIPKVRESAKSV